MTAADKQRFLKQLTRVAPVANKPNPFNSNCTDMPDPTRQKKRVYIDSPEYKIDPETQKTELKSLTNIKSILWRRLRKGAYFNGASSNIVCLQAVI